MRYEILNEQGDVIDIVEADLSFMQSQYESWQYRQAPNAAPETPPNRKITKGAFQNRLGVMNVFAIDNGTNPICVALRSCLGRLEYVDLGHPQTEQMLYMLVFNNQPEADPAFQGSGPITGEIAESVLMAPVQDHERP